MRDTKRRLQHFLQTHRELWNHDGIRPAARLNFQKVVDCGTEALGAEIFASASEERVVYRTCKSPACSSCGRRATILWQRDQSVALPDIPYRQITLTMPDVLWPIFRDNRALLRDLSAIGGKLVETWMQAEHGAKVLIIVVPHSFGRHLTFNSHLHILVSRGGYVESRNRWVPELHVRKAALAKFWRDSVIDHLQRASQLNQLHSELDPASLEQMLAVQRGIDWRTHHQFFAGKYHFLRYAARYLRRPPIAEYRFTRMDDEQIIFRTQDHRLKREVLTQYTPQEFVRALADQVPEIGEHCVRYFGLLAPRTRAHCMDGILTILGKPRGRRPRRPSWNLSIKQEFGIDPLVDRQGVRMRRIGRRPGTRVRARPRDTKANR
jgi:hypothetical protein